jgi:hypothetical protein
MRPIEEGSMKTSEILKAGLALIQKGFAQGSYACLSNGETCTVTNPDACCFCSYGALYRTLGHSVYLAPTSQVAVVEEFLLLAAKEQAQTRPGTRPGEARNLIIYINDKLGLEATVKMWTRAIELAEAQEAKSRTPNVVVFLKEVRMFDPSTGRVPPGAALDLEQVKYDLARMGMTDAPLLFRNYLERAVAELEALRAALDAQPPQAPQKDRWQPIETAPKMRTILLFAVTDLADDGTVLNWKTATGSWHTGYEDDRSKAQGLTPWEWDGHRVKVYELHPTHWMPLPDPPIAEGRRAQEHPNGKL